MDGPGGHEPPQLTAHAPGGRRWIPLACRSRPPSGTALRGFHRLVDREGDVEVRPAPWRSDVISLPPFATPLTLAQDSGLHGRKRPRSPRKGRYVLSAPLLAAETPFSRPTRLNDLTKQPILEAYAIFKAVAKTDLSVKTAITPALDYYANIAKAGMATRKKNAAAKQAAQAAQPAVPSTAQATQPTVAAAGQVSPVALK